MTASERLAEELNLLRSLLKRIILFGLPEPEPEPTMDPYLASLLDDLCYQRSLLLVEDDENDTANFDLEQEELS